jgi:hypothetical protein
MFPSGATGSRASCYTPAFQAWRIATTLPSTYAANGLVSGPRRACVRPFSITELFLGRNRAEVTVADAAVLASRPLDFYGAWSVIRAKRERACIVLVQWRWVERRRSETASPPTITGSRATVNAVAAIVVPVGAAVSPWPDPTRGHPGGAICAFYEITAPPNPASNQRDYVGDGPSPPAGRCACATGLHRGMNRRFAAWWGSTHRLGI